MTLKSGIAASPISATRQIQCRVAADRGRQNAMINQATAISTLPLIAASISAGIQVAPQPDSIVAMSANM